MSQTVFEIVFMEKFSVLYSKFNFFFYCSNTNTRAQEGNKNKKKVKIQIQTIHYLQTCKWFTKKGRTESPQLK
jgi:hypothetical protein